MLARLPYHCPRTMFKMLLPFVALCLNLFPVSTRTDFLSAFQILYNRSAEANKDCNLEFGALYHVTERDTVNSNSMAPPTHAAIGAYQIINFQVVSSLVQHYRLK